MIIDKAQFRSLRKNPLFIFGFVIVAVAILISLGGAFIRPDSSPHANAQHLEIARLKPLSTVAFLRLEKEDFTPDSRGISTYFVGSRKAYEEFPIDSIYRSTDGQIVYQRIGSDEILSLSSGDLTSLSAAKSPNENDLKNIIHEKTFILGTDKYGRDLLSRLMSGTYISLSVGIISVMISLILGIILGLISGYYRGWIDRVILWFINVVWSVPTLLLVIAITLVLGKGFWQIFIAVGLTMWVEVARVVRGQVLSIREKEFVEAGVVLGFSNSRIIRRHLLPNVLSPVIVISAANFATAILLEAGLSFLGIGASPPIATWGKMISEHKSYLITGDAHLALIPGIAIMLLVLSFTFIGNGLRDALDERKVSST